MTFFMLCEICGILPPDMVNRATPIFFEFQQGGLHACFAAPKANWEEENGYFNRRAVI